MRVIDWLLLKRLAGSVLLAVVGVFAIVVMIEGLSIHRYVRLATRDGVLFSVAALGMEATRWVLDTLPLSVLVGLIIGLLNLQASREMTIIKAAGISVWRMMVFPVAAVLVAGLMFSTVVDTVTIELDRSLFPSTGDRSEREVWLEERSSGLNYLMHAESARADGMGLNDVSVFLLDPPRDRIEAKEAVLQNRQWVMADAVRYTSSAAPQALNVFSVPTSRTSGDMRTRLTAVSSMTVFELGRTLASDLSDASLRNAILTRFVQHLGLPLALVGSVVIAFAFTGGYRRTNKFAGAVLNGIVLGFVVYVISEMAARAGSAGALPPVVAVLGPALIAILSGTTVLLYKEDGRR